MQHSASTLRRMFTSAHCSSMNAILPHHCLITLSMHSESSPTHLRPPILRTVDVSTAGRSLLQACAPAAALLVGHLLATHPYQAALHVFCDVGARPINSTYMDSSIDAPLHLCLLYFLLYFAFCFNWINYACEVRLFVPCSIFVYLFILFDSGHAYHRF